MDRPFIIKMCDAYYNDFELYKEHIWENKDVAVSEFSNYIIQEIDSIKFSNIPLYESIFELSRTHQYHIIYNLLDQYLNEKYEIDNTEINSTLVNEDILATTFGTIGAAIGGVGDILTSIVSGTALATTSIFGVTLGSLIILALLFFGIKHISYAKAKAAVLLSHAANSLAKFVDQVTLRSRLENSIIFANLEVCGHRCGIQNFRNLDRFTTFVLHGVKLTEKSEKQYICLYGCFLKTIFSLVETTAIAYVNCLKNSGDKLGLIELNAINVLLKPPSSSNCKVYYTQLTEFDKEFNDSIDELSSSQDDKDKLIADYHKVLDAALKGNSGFNKPFQSISNSNSNPNFKSNYKPNFNPKHQLPYKN